MFQLVIVVMAVGLAALLVVGGMPYFDSSTGTKLKTQQILQGQLEGIVGAISSYKSSHGGFLPPNDITALQGLMPQGIVPTLPYDVNVRWSLSGGNLCLNRDNIDTAADGIKNGINAFAQNVVRSSAESTVYFGSSCSDPSPVLVTQGASFPEMVKNNQISIIFKGL
jgi:hypothetical protein